MRQEIEVALKNDVPLIPVLVMGATIPKASELPESIRSLSERSASHVRQDPDFHPDVQRLCDAIEKILGLSRTPKQSEIIDNILDLVRQEQFRSREREQSIQAQMLNSLNRLERSTLDRHSELIESITIISSRLDSISEKLRDQQRHLRLLDGSVGELLRHDGLVQSDMHDSAFDQDAEPGAPADGGRDTGS